MMSAQLRGSSGCTAVALRSHKMIGSPVSRIVDLPTQATADVVVCTGLFLLHMSPRCQSDIHAMRLVCGYEWMRLQEQDADGTGEMKICGATVKTKRD